MQTFDHNVGFKEKRHFFPKIGVIAENSGHNIDPMSNVFLLQFFGPQTIFCAIGSTNQFEKYPFVLQFIFCRLGVQAGP
jgi:hypothetical protein